MKPHIASSPVRGEPGKLWSWRMANGALPLVLVGVIPSVRAQESAAVAPSLVFEGVTVVDVEAGKLRPAQRVMIVGNRIQAMGDVGTVRLPAGAQVVDARGKYLISGLWDMHVHTTTYLNYPLLLANGVTGFRDARSLVPLDTMVQWRREILAGTRVGPPRQLLNGTGLNRESDQEIADLKARGPTFSKCMGTPPKPSQRRGVWGCRSAATYLMPSATARRQWRLRTLDTASSTTQMYLED